jgi:PAS domain S-box-containing protein
MKKRGLIFKALAVIGIPALIQIVAFATLATQIELQNHEAKQAQHFSELKDCVADALRDMIKVTTNADWGHNVYFVSEDFQDTYQDYKGQLDKLRQLMKGSAEEALFAKQLKNSNEMEAELNDGIAAVQAGEMANLQNKADRLVERSRALVKELVDDSEHIDQICEQQKQEALGREQALRERVQQIILFFFLAEAAAVVCIVIWLNGDVNRRLQVLLTNSTRLALEQPLLKPVDGQDEIADLDAVFHQMAEALKQSTEHERAIIENARDMILTFDRSGVISGANTAVQILTGYFPDELIGQRAINLLVEEDRERFINRLEVHTDQEFEARVRGKLGEVLSLLWSVSWSDKERSFFCIAHDVTERKKAERLKQEVMQMVSHDLRTPLFTITAFLEMLSKGLFGQLTEKGQKLLNNSCQSGVYMETLIKDLLEMEKLESSDVLLSKQQCEVQNILIGASNAISGAANHASVQIRVDTTDATFMADRDRILQVVVNLASNAIKFSPANSTVTLSSRVRNGNIEIAVSDQGRGIRENDLPFIFDRFRQTESADGSKGVGLGLAICKKLVELHGGQISVASREGRGSTFSFTIPYNGMN